MKLLYKGLCNETALISFLEWTPLTPIVGRGQNLNLRHFGYAIPPNDKYNDRSLTISQPPLHAALRPPSGVHRAPLHQAYKPCFIRRVPPQNYRRPPAYKHIGLWWLCPTDTRLKACKYELQGPPMVALRPVQVESRGALFWSASLNWSARMGTVRR